MSESGRDHHRSRTSSREDIIAEGELESSDKRNRAGTSSGRHHGSRHSSHHRSSRNADSHQQRSSKHGSKHRHGHSTTSTGHKAQSDGHADQSGSKIDQSESKTQESSQEQRLIQGTALCTSSQSSMSVLKLWGARLGGLSPPKLTNWPPVLQSRGDCAKHSNALV